MTDCGCRVEVHMYLETTGYQVVYCPLHAAAPRLAEALRNLVWDHTCEYVQAKDKHLGLKCCFCEGLEILNGIPLTLKPLA